MASAYLYKNLEHQQIEDIGTISFWMKRSVIDLNNMYILSNYDNGNSGYIRFKSDNQLRIIHQQQMMKKEQIENLEMLMLGIILF